MNEGPQPSAAAFRVSTFCAVSPSAATAVPSAGGVSDGAGGIAVGGVSRSRADEQHDPHAWRRQAICRGDAAADFFTPFGGETRRQRAARERRAIAVCADCPVRADCLADAVGRDERYGIWGGRAFDERTSLKHQPPLPTHLRPTA